MRTITAPVERTVEDLTGLYFEADPRRSREYNGLVIGTIIG
jgi:hypothetical protein